MISPVPRTIALTRELHNQGCGLTMCSGRNVCAVKWFGDHRSAACKSPQNFWPQEAAPTQEASGGPAPPSGGVVRAGEFRCSLAATSGGPAHVPGNAWGAEWRLRTEARPTQTAQPPRERWWARGTEDAVKPKSAPQAVLSHAAPGRCTATALAPRPWRAAHPEPRTEPWAMARMGKGPAPLCVPWLPRPVLPGSEMLRPRSLYVPTGRAQSQVAGRRAQARAGGGGAGTGRGCISWPLCRQGNPYPQ